jgi:hypothetical protein
MIQAENETPRLISDRSSSKATKQRIFYVHRKFSNNSSIKYRERRCVMMMPSLYTYISVYILYNT